jgi:hypothetical protein
MISFIWYHQTGADDGNDHDGALAGVGGYEKGGNKPYLTGSLPRPGEICRAVNAASLPFLLTWQPPFGGRPCLMPLSLSAPPPEASLRCSQTLILIRMLRP